MAPLEKDFILVVRGLDPMPSDEELQARYRRGWTLSVRHRDDENRIVVCDVHGVMASGKQLVDYDCARRAWGLAQLRHLDEKTEKEELNRHVIAVTNS